MERGAPHWQNPGAIALAITPPSLPGAGAASRQAIGWVVFGGMLVGTGIGVDLAPFFSRIIQAIAERVVPARAS